MTAHILLFAAGGSSRMRGGDKLMEPIDGVPLIRRQTVQALGTGLPVHVILPPDRPERTAAIADLPAERITAADAGDGMSASFRAGVGALPDGAKAGIMMLADMPQITSRDLLRLVKRWRQAPEFPARLTTPDGRTGTPVLFPSRLFAPLLRLRGDEGGRTVLRGETVLLVPCPDDRAIVDLDTREDWLAWRKRHEK